MSTAEVSHAETWHIEIKPEKGVDTWPDVEGYNKMMIRPEALVIELQRHRGKRIISVRGRQVRKDDSPGVHLRTVGLGYWAPVPEWVLELVEAVRRQHDLGPGATGVDW